MTRTNKRIKTYQNSTHTNSKTERFIKANGSTANVTDAAFKFGKMALISKDTGVITRLMAKAVSFTPMATCMKVTG